MAIQVDYEQLQSSASQLQSAQQEMESQLARLQSMINGLTQAGFRTDIASGKFQQSYEQWTTGAKNVIGGLEGMSAFLNRAISQHRELDTQLGQATGG